MVQLYLDLIQLTYFSIIASTTIIEKATAALMVVESTSLIITEILDTPMNKNIRPIPINQCLQEKKKEYNKSWQKHLNDELLT